MTFFLFFLCYGLKYIIVFFMNTKLGRWVSYNFEEISKFRGDYLWFQGSLTMQSLCLFWSYQIRTKDNISSKQASWFHVCLRHTKCSLSIYCWIIRAKGFNIKNNLSSFFPNVILQYPKVILFAEMMWR
jgi:hypothetical protein